MDFKVRIGNGNQVHRASVEGVVLCGSQRRNQRSVSFLPNDTPVTCQKCGVEDEVEVVEAPVSERVIVDGVCHNPVNHGSPVKINRFGNCGVCEYI